MKFKKLGFEIENETHYGKKYYRWIMVEDGKRCDMKSGFYSSKKAAEKAANENIDYLCERYNYTR